MGRKCSMVVNRSNAIFQLVEVVIERSIMSILIGALRNAPEMALVVAVTCGGR